MEERNKLVLIGGGGHCKSVLDAVIRPENFDEVVITDPGISVETTMLGCRVVGNDEILSELFMRGFKNAFITIGSIRFTDRRRNAFLMAERIVFSPSVIDPSVVIAHSAFIAPGVFIGKNAVVNADAVVEKMAIINTGAVIEHDCRI